MRIALISDAWSPQVNGVVRTLAATVVRLRARGHAVETVTPDQFGTVKCPTYPEIRLALAPQRQVTAQLDRFAPDAVHVATEGPLGWAARRYCLKRGRPFTTSFHTRFPDYLAARTGLPEGWFWPPMRHFHGAAAQTFAATERLRDELTARGLGRTHRWSRGVDLSLFSPAGPVDAELARLPRPIQLYVGRVAVEKNIEAFLATREPGTKIVVGGGPALPTLITRHPDVRFLGPLHGAALAAAYRVADVLAFPSLTDTFGLVIVEALASGVPVAAFPVAGPLDILGRDGRGSRGAVVGALDEDLGAAIRRALGAAAADCAAEAGAYCWDNCTDQFVAGLAAA